jgi:uncharacterized OB-fold protein
MSENPNPTRCGNCGTMNPPGQEYCASCHAPLTLAAGAVALEGTPEAKDEARRYEAAPEPETPEVVVMGGLGGAPIPVPAERIDLDPDAPPRS